MNDIVYLFDGSFDGFLTVFFESYTNKIVPFDIIEENKVQMSLCYEYVKIETDKIKAERVFKGIEKNISRLALENCFEAFLSDNEKRFIYIWRYLKLGFKVGKKIDDYKTDDSVLAVLKMSGNVSHEAHLLTGFLRFSETKENVLYAKFCAKNDVLQILAEHFSDRFNSEKWIIHDVNRKKAAIYNDGEYIITELDFELNIELSEDEQMYKALWKEFFDVIAVENRKNPILQRNMLPKKYRKYMNEFWEKP